MIRIKIIIDKRTPKKNGKYPLKLRVTEYNQVRHISLNAEYSEREFKEITKDVPSDKWKSHKDSIIKIVEKAEKIKGNMVPFDFNKFKTMLFQKVIEETPNTLYLNDLFDVIIKKHRDKDAIRTATLYNTAKNKFMEFKKVTRIEDINESYLNDFEKWYLNKNKGKLTATIAIYLRNLRTVINYAISKELVNPNYRTPFNRNIYVIPNVKTAKKTLTNEEVEKLATFTNFKDNDEKLALNLWLFQFRCNGINLKDLLLLKWSQRSNNCFVLNREKTKRTTRGNPHPIVIPITPKLESQLKILGKPDSPYVLGYMKDGFTETQILEKRAKVAKAINGKLDEIAERLKLSVPLKTKTARDAYATYLRNKGQSIEVISGNLGHSSINTTRHYLASFDTTTLHQVNNLLP